MRYEFWKGCKAQRNARYLIEELQTQRPARLAQFSEEMVPSVYNVALNSTREAK